MGTRRRISPRYCHLGSNFLRAESRRRPYSSNNGSTHRMTLVNVLFSDKMLGFPTRIVGSIWVILNKQESVGKNASVIVRFVRLNEEMIIYEP